MPSLAQQIRVKSTHVSPPGGWSVVVVQADERHLDSDSSLDALRVRLEEWLVSQGKDPAPALAMIHETTAKRLVSAGHKNLIEFVGGDTARSVGQYASGATAMMLKWWMESPIKGLLKGKFERGESVFVEPAEANRRAAICLLCPENVIPTGKNWLQNWTDGKMLDAVMGRTVKRQADLGVCRACTCELRAAVHWPADILAATTSREIREKLPEKSACWKAAILN